jgi:hypothetical protein
MLDPQSTVAAAACHGVELLQPDLPRARVCSVVALKNTDPWLDGASGRCLPASSSRALAGTVYSRTAIGEEGQLGMVELGEAARG